MFTDLARAAMSTEPAQWVVDSLVTFAVDVRSLVPGTHDAYVRVLHPAMAQPSGAAVRWGSVAAANARTAHPLMQWQAITGGWEYMHERSQPPLWDREPAEGTLPADIGSRLVEVLGPRTTTADVCWFAVWEGFGALPDEVRAAPKFSVPARAYHLFVGPVVAVTEPVMPVFTQSPNIWWPDDRAWCVATEIDLMSTYVGCSRRCADELLAVPALETYEVRSTDGIDFASDTVNPTAPPG